MKRQPSPSGDGGKPEIISPTASEKRKRPKEINVLIDTFELSRDFYRAGFLIFLFLETAQTDISFLYQHKVFLISEGLLGRC